MADYTDRTFRHQLVERRVECAKNFIHRINLASLQIKKVDANPNYGSKARWSFWQFVSFFSLPVHELAALNENSYPAQILTSKNKVFSKQPLSTAGIMLSQFTIAGGPSIKDNFFDDFPWYQNVKGKYCRAHCILFSSSQMEAVERQTLKLQEPNTWGFRKPQGINRESRTSE